MNQGLVKFSVKGGDWLGSYFKIIIMTIVFLLISLSNAYADNGSLQELIDAAEPGDTILVKQGEYHEAIVIDKSIQLIGEEGATLIYQGEEPAILIRADHVNLENFKVYYQNVESLAPAILVHGNHNRLQHLDIETNSFGIQLDQADKNTIAYSKILGDRKIPLTQRQHGIDLWESDDNEIYENQIQFVNDGIYIERSHYNLVRDNQVSYARYGYHLMFTKYSTLTQNKSSKNISGMMVMGTEGTTVTHNQLFDNKRHVQSLGLLLFDVKNAIVTENDIINNRVGVFIENAKHNEVTHNLIQGNYIGIRFKFATENHIHQNAFIANVVQGQAENSDQNDVNQNYWADHLGLDLDGDQLSNIAYEVDPFFLKITDDYPPFQLLFQAPGMIFLESLIDISDQEKLIDRSPLLLNPISNGDDSTSSQLPVFLLSLGLLLISLLIMYMGVKVNEKI